MIACYVAMEHSLADRGARRGAADTPTTARQRGRGGDRPGPGRRQADRAVLEARFSTHPVTVGQRAAASAALDERPAS